MECRVVAVLMEMASGINIVENDITTVGERGQRDIANDILQTSLRTDRAHPHGSGSATGSTIRPGGLLAGQIPRHEAGHGGPAGAFEKGSAGDFIGREAAAGGAVSNA